MLVSPESVHALDAPAALGPALAARRASSLRCSAQLGAILLLVAACLWYADFFNLHRYVEGAAGNFQIIIREGMPPDFSRYALWGRPILDTLAMSIA